MRYLFSLEMMEENYNTSETDDLDFYDGKPAGERWAPLGANDLDDESTCYLHSSGRYVCFSTVVPRYTICAYFPIHCYYIVTVSGILVALVR